MCYSVYPYPYVGLILLTTTRSLKLPLNNTYPCPNIIGSLPAAIFLVLYSNAGGPWVPRTHAPRTTHHAPTHPRYPQLRSTPPPEHLSITHRQAWAISHSSPETTFLTSSLPSDRKASSVTPSLTQPIYDTDNVRK